MAYPKRLNAQNKTNQEKAIESHAAFVRFVASEVTKKGLKRVLSSSKRDELYWLKEAYERVLDFAEQVQIKQVPTKLEGTGEDGAIRLVIRATADQA